MNERCILVAEDDEPIRRALADTLAGAGYEVLAAEDGRRALDNICVITVIHDLNLAIRYCDLFLFLKDSHCYCYGGVETMTPENIERVYGMHVHIIETMGIPVIVPFPDEKVHN